MKPGLIEENTDTGASIKIALSADNAKNCEVDRIAKNCDTSAKPYQSYFGGKGSSGTFQTIINLIPPHENYFEGFVGNGSIFINKLESSFSYLNDIDFEVWQKWVELKGLNANVHNTDIIYFLEYYREELNSKKSFVYLDPPYLLETRKSKHRYKHEMTTLQHRELLRYIQELKCNIIISTYPNAMYAAELKNWHLVEFESVTRSGKKATEHLYLNYNPADITELHDYRYFGKNFRDRERIKRIAKNLESKIYSMPSLERNAIFSMITNNL